MSVSSAGIKISSGRVEGTKKIREAVQRGKDRAVLLGIAAMLAKHLNTVAYKTGAFSAAVSDSYRNQQKTQKGRDEIIIRLDRGIIIAEVPYGKYHINPGGSFGAFYENPTTDNTKPINQHEWNETVADEIEALLPAEMVKEGLVVSELRSAAGGGMKARGSSGRFESNI